MTSNLNSAGANVATTGINKIDDIYITGKMIETSVSEKDAEYLCKVFPFPADQQLTISTTSPISNLILYDLNGKIHFQQSVTRLLSTTIPVAELPAGLYLLSINQGNGHNVIRKVTVAH
jgi:hypothetical protein